MPETVNHTMALTWHESEDIVRGVLSKLQSNIDLLNCDLVCRRWRALQQPLPQPASLTAEQAAHQPWLRWLVRNAHRLVSLTLSGCSDSLTCNRQMWQLLSQAHGLQQLLLNDYKALSSLPPSIVDLTSLRDLRISSSKGNGSINSSSSGSSSSGQPNSSSSSSRQVEQLCGLQELPEGTGALKQLQRLELQHCSALQSLPEGITGCTALTTLILDVAASDNPAYDPVITTSPLKHLPAATCQLPHLQQLSLRGCNALTDLPDALGALSSLTLLEMEGCHGLKVLPDSIEQLQALRCLHINGANSLEVLPEGVGCLGNLTQLSLSYCHHLHKLPESLGQLQYLRVLDIGCHGLVDHLPPSIGNLPQLQRLTIDCASLNDIPDSISRLTTLTWLTISHCLGLQQLPEGLGNLQQLRRLVIDTVPNVYALPDSISMLESLEELHLLNDSEFDGLPKLPQQMERLTRLTKLQIGTVPGIEHELPSIPGSIGVLSGLKELHIGQLHLTAAEQ